MNYNQWEIKQLLDIISKGVNSVLMTKPDTPPETLKILANTLLDIYEEILTKMKGNVKEYTKKTQEINFPEDEEL